MIIELGSVTDLTEEYQGRVAVVGSHGGELTGRFAERAGVAALICHDAGVGLEGAGVAALGYLDRCGVPAIAVGHMSARIGDPADMMKRGIVSHANACAASLGVTAGQDVRAALTVFEAIPFRQVPGGPKPDANTILAEEEIETGGVKILLLDSASKLSARHDGAIVITGSHGGLPGNEISRALRARPVLVVFNDAGIGIDRAGIARLPVLQDMGIAALCVDAGSARIGSARSSYENGLVSIANSLAAELGAEPGMPLKLLAGKLVGLSDHPTQSGKVTS